MHGGDGERLDPRRVLRERLAERRLDDVTVVQAGFLTDDHAGPAADFVRDLVDDIEPAGVDAFMAEWCAGAIDDPSRGDTADDLAEHVRTEHSTFTWLFEPLLAHAGFTILERAMVRRAYGADTCRRR